MKEPSDSELTNTLINDQYMSKLLLPGEISKVTCNYMEKSAEVIVIADNEPAPVNGKSRMVSQSNEGRNIKSLLIPNGGLNIKVYQPPESATGISDLNC